jgi:hypothetical protein
MRNKVFICAAFCAFLSCRAFAGEFKDKGETIAVDFPSGWTAGKSDDPSVTLKLEKGKSFFEFSKQDSELGDYYLKARVKEQVDSLRSKGTSLSGDIKSVSLHGVSDAYYTTYESMGNPACMAFFTYNGVSYAVSASGMDEGDFRGVIASVRKPGEKIELPKPKRVRVARRKKAKDEDESEGRVIIDNETAASTAAVAASTVTEAAALVSTAAVPAAAAEASTQTAAGAAAQSFMAGLAAKRDGKGLPPYLPRKPLPLAVWAALIAAWVAGSFVARSKAAAYQNPKLPPPPTDVPPDFFFPFVVSKVSTMEDVTYNVVTRQKQLLLADYMYEHTPYLVGGFYGCLFFHVGWSLLAFAGRDQMVTNALMLVPFLGRALASLPEIFFIVPAFVGAAMMINKKRQLNLYDAQSTLVMSVTPEVSYGLIRDGAGKEVARLVRKGGFMSRRWEFVDTDNSVVFSIHDDFPAAHLMRMLFGNLGGALRCRYGIFAQERRAGFVFLDPSSADRFQIHMDFAFARLGHPAQILAAVLFVVSREKDPIYPSPF